MMGLYIYLYAYQFNSFDVFLVGQLLFYIKQGAENFELAGKVVDFVMIKETITILNSRKEDRVKILVEPKKSFAGKLPKKGTKDDWVMFGGGFFDRLVDLVWNMLSWSRIDSLEEATASNENTALGMSEKTAG